MDYTRKYREAREDFLAAMAAAIRQHNITSANGRDNLHQDIIEAERKLAEAMDALNNTAIHEEDNNGI